MIPSIPNEAVVMTEWIGEGSPVIGQKNDQGKDDWLLLFGMLSGPLHDILRGLMYGAKKYNEDPANPNFQRVTDWRRRFGNALLRHAFALLNGEEIDPESGVPHASLLAINALFYRWHERNNSG